MDSRIFGWNERKDNWQAAETGLDEDWFDQTYAGRASVYKNIWLNGHLFLKLAIVSGSGLYAIIPYEGKADAAMGQMTREILGVDASNSVIVYHSADISLVLSRDGMSLTPIADIYGFFHEKLRDGAEKEGRVLDAQSVTRLQGRLSALENADRPITEADNMIECDGLLFVRRHDPVLLGLIDLGLAGEKHWYPVADDNTDRLVTEAAFGGWFGLHRFAQGEIAEGLLYLLTCGCMGVLPALDIVQYLTGSKYVTRVEYENNGNLTRVKTRMFLRKPNHTAWSILCIFIAFFAAFAAWRVLYQTAVPAFIRGFLGVVWPGDA